MIPALFDFLSSRPLASLCLCHFSIIYLFIVLRFSYNPCTPFKHDIRCASLCGVEFVFTKERREKRAQRESCLKGVRALHGQPYSYTNYGNSSRAINQSNTLSDDDSEYGVYERIIMVDTYLLTFKKDK